MLPTIFKVNRIQKIKGFCFGGADDTITTCGGLIKYEGIDQRFYGDLRIIPL